MGERNWKIRSGFMVMIIGNLLTFLHIEGPLMDALQGFCLGAGISLLLIGCICSKGSSKLRSFKKRLLNRLTQKN